MSQAVQPITFWLIISALIANRPAKHAVLVYILVLLAFLMKHTLFIIVLPASPVRSAQLDTMLTQLIHLVSNAQQYARNVHHILAVQFVRPIIIYMVRPA